MQSYIFNMSFSSTHNKFSQKKKKFGSSAMLVL